MGMFVASYDETTRMARFQIDITGASQTHMCLHLITSRGGGDGTHDECGM